MRWVEQWAAASDVPAAVPPGILELADESSVVTYANTMPSHDVTMDSEFSSPISYLTI